MTTQNSNNLVGTNLSGGCFCPDSSLITNRISIQPNPKGVSGPETSNLNRMGVALSDCYKKDPNSCGYKGVNPLLRDAARGWLNLDRPHLTGELGIGNNYKSEIYNKNINRYGGIYPNYNSIPSGQIQYYVDSNLSGAYYEPIFTTPSVVTMNNITDPMSNVYTQYDRKPLVSYNWKPKSCPQDKACGIEGEPSCFSESHDMITFREDLMARQQRKNLETDWQARWVQRQC